MVLTRNELFEISGYKRASYQIGWLTKNSYPFEVAADGYPRVLTSYVNNRLGGLVTSTPKVKRNKPNFSVLMSA